MATWLITRTPEGRLRLLYSPSVGSAWDCGVVDDGIAVEALVEWICLRGNPNPYERVLLPDNRVLVFLPRGGCA